LINQLAGNSTTMSKYHGGGDKMSTKTMDVIQSILEYLDKSMDDDRVDITPINDESLEISYPRWCRIIGMLLEDGLIEGFSEVNSSGVTYSQYKSMDPRITLSGLKFLSDNSNLGKLYRAAKEIKDWIPGI
jgi:predicted transcriptional regulator